MSSVDPCAVMATELEGFRIALQDIAAGVGCCSVCGVEYTAGYEGPCQEGGAAFEGRYARTWVCPGSVSVRGTAAKALKA